jgi:AcrR family transcriptional regulator
MFKWTLTEPGRRLKGAAYDRRVERAPVSPRPRAALVNARSRETRRAIVRASLRLWSEGDFDAAYEASTVAEIARAAGVSRGTFYFHFTGKDEILLEMSSGTALAMLGQIEDGVSRGVPLHPLAGQVMTSMCQRVLRGPRAAAQKVSALALRAEADAVPLAGARLGTAFEALVRYGKERGELGPEVEEEETVTLLALVTADAIVRWGSGNRSTAWLEQALPSRVEVILAGATRTAER